MTDRARLRVADADREQLAGELREHMLAGRLSSEEFEARLEKAYRASTQAELDALREDLPMSVAVLEGQLAKRRARLRRRLAREAEGALGASALCVAIWAAAGASGSFWPIWVIVVTLLPVVRGAWCVLGPEPDLETLEAQLNARHERRLARERRRAHRRELRG